MALVSSPTPPTTEGRSFWLFSFGTFLSSLFVWFDQNTPGARRMHKIKATRAKSPSELAQLDLKPDDIADHVFFGTGRG